MVPKCPVDTEFRIIQTRDVRSCGQLCGIYCPVDTLRCYFSLFLDLQITSTWGDSSDSRSSINCKNYACCVCSNIALICSCSAYRATCDIASLATDSKSVNVTSICELKSWDRTPGHPQGVLKRSNAEYLLNICSVQITPESF